MRDRIASHFLPGNVRTRLALWCCLLFLALQPACANFNELTGPTLVPGVVATVEVPTTQTQLSVGTTLALQARVRDAGGNTVVDKSVLWTSSDTTIARVSAAGVVTGMAAGTVRIAASVQGRSAVTTLNVTARAVATVMVNPPSPNILVGGQLQLASITLGESGDVLVGRSVTWETSNPLVASIDNTGLLTGLAPGVTTIKATSETRSASVGVTVLPVPVAAVQISPAVDTVVVGQTTQLTAVTRDSIGTPLPDRTVAWISSNSAVASVSASGLVVGTQAGTVTITASSEGKSGTARIVVQARPVGSVIVSPSQVAMIAGQTVKLSVVITDDNGTLLTGRPIQYASGNTNVARVATDGTVTGVSEGVTKITVTSEGRTGNADVVVSASPIATVRITAPLAEMSIGATQKLTVTLLDAGNNPLPSRPVTWTSGAPGIASISADGTVSGLSAGGVVIFAQVEGKLAQVSLSVRAITVTSVSVAPAAVDMFVGDALDFGAQARDGSGAVVVGRTVLWSTSDERIAVVSSTGRVRAIGSGQALITASVDGVQGSSAVTTKIEPVLTITAEPPQLNLLPLQSATVVATPRGRSGVPLQRAVTFATQDASIATVTSAGLVTAIKTGKTTITASSEGKSVTIPVEVGNAPVNTVTVSLGAAARYISQTTTATAETRDAQNNILSGRPVVWSSTNQSVATVSSTGVVTAVGAGTARITAASEGKSGFATITVTPVPIASITVSLTDPARHVGETTQATATPKDSIGGTLTGRTVVWSSSNTNIATVTPTGLVSAVAPGTANIIATSEGKTSSAAIVVTPVPVANVQVTLAIADRYVLESTTATAKLTDASGNTLTGRTIAWTSSNTNVATVNAAGVVTAIAPGTADITATSETKSGSAKLTVTLAPVASVVVSLQNPARYVGQTTQASVVLRDRNGNQLSNRVVTWASADANIATVSATGLVTAVAPGTRNITATSEGVSGSAAITVSLVPVATVTVTAPQTELTVGQTTQATAVPRDSANGVLNNRTITWRSSNTSFATVSNTGLITAVGQGDVIITATSEGKSGTFSMKIVLIPVASVTVAVDKVPVWVAFTAQATATMRDGSGNTLNGRSATWQSADVGVATINSATGVITGVAPGSTLITGTSEGVSGTFTVNVTLAPVDTVKVVLANSALLTGATTQATVTLKDAGGRTLSNRAITYSSSDPNIATVSASGLVTAVNPGSVNITATSEGKSGFAILGVALPPVATVALRVNSNNNTVPVGGTIQTLIELRDVNGNVATGRTIAWSSSNTSVATVDAQGRVSGKAVGPVTITALVEGKTGQLTLTVVPAPVASVTLELTSPTIRITQSTTSTVVLKDANGNVLTGRDVTYTSSNPLIASVSQTGVVQAFILPGTATIRATSEGITGEAVLTVTVFPVNTVDVQLASTNIVATTTTQATAVLKDILNNTLENRVVVWTTSDASVATVDASGLVTGIGAGTVNVTATSEGKSGSAQLTVTPAPVATVEVFLSPATIQIGATTQASAVTRDAANRVLNGRAIAWTSSNTSVATVSASGVVTAMTAGTTNITATSEGKAGFATLTVTLPPPEPVATVQVSLNANSVVAGGTTQANAITRDASNGVLNGRTIAWSSTNTAVATVDANGLVTTLTAGTTDITATSEGKAGFATLTVTAPAPAPVQTVETSVSPASVVAGATSQASVVLKDLSGNTLTGRTIAWSTSDPAVATVDATGLVTTLKEGTVIITATAEGKSGQATLTVTPAPVANVVVTLESTTFAVNESMKAAVVLTSQNGTVLTGRTVTWSSTDENVARVNPAGVVKAEGVGSATITATSEGKTGSVAITVR